nr:MAG TPA: hypothetical protein [Bacteriophage sp.]
MKHVGSCAPASHFLVRFQLDCRTGDLYNV